MVRNKEEEEIHKKCEIARDPKFCYLETDRILGGIKDVFVERATKELFVASIKVGDVKLKTTKSKTRHSVITPEEMSWKFNIGIDKAKEMLKLTTQKGIGHAVHSLQRIYRVDNM